MKSALAARRITVATFKQAMLRLVSTLRGASPHHLTRILFLVASVALVIWGYTLMRESTSQTAPWISLVADSGRLASIQFRHICNENGDEIDVSYILRPGAEDGYILIRFAGVLPGYSSRSWSPPSVRRHPYFDNAYCIDYDETSILTNQHVVTFDVSPQPAPSDSVTYRIPSQSELDGRTFTATYELYPMSDTEVSVLGTPGDPTPHVVGLKWHNVASNFQGTSVTLRSSRTRRNAQRSLALGAILISLGANLLTSYIFSRLGKRWLMVE